MIISQGGDPKTEFIYNKVVNNQNKVVNNQALRDYLAKGFRDHGFDPSKMSEKDYDFKFETKNGRDLQLAFQNVRLARPRIEGNTLTLLLIDRYDFEFDKNDKFSKASLAAIAQALGVMNEYYIGMSLRFNITDLLKRK